MADRNYLRSISTTKLWVGAGAIYDKSIDGVRNVLKNEDIDGIIFGSMTMEERPGNSGDVYDADEIRSINSIGLKNYGAANYGELLAEIVEYVHSKGKKIIISVAADTPEDFGALTMLVLNSGADGIELNFGCPNKWAGGKQGTIMSFDLASMKSTLIIIQACINHESVSSNESFVVGVKLSPYSNPMLIPEVAALLNRFECVTYVACSNTFPNCYDERDDGQPVISKTAANPNGFGGGAGPMLFPIALGQVKQFRNVLKNSIAIMGVGGISTGMHMHKFLKNGADAVQVVTPYFTTENPAVFSVILGEYMQIKVDSEQVPAAQ